MRGATTTTTTIDTVNAAATAIVSAESRVQPPSVPKRRWKGCWSMYWCFGSQKVNKRIGHAVLVPEPEASRVAQPSSTETQIQTHSTTVVHPFIAPPSSPASFLQSEPPSVTQSPGGLLSLKSLPADAYSPRGPPSMFAIGPYAHETQLVTPPVFSAFTTEPSTAPFTPPPESVQLTTPSSPEVPFAQLLTSSLERARRNSGGTTSKFGFYNYEFPQVYSGSPSGQLISPGSVISNSGTCSPFPDRHPVHEFRTGDATKLIGFEHFNTRKWGSRLGSGTVTPDGVGRGSRFASGTATPDGVGLGSRLGSGTVTPDGVGLGSRLGSGTNTPDGMWVVGPTLGSGTATPDGVGLGSRLGSGTATPDGMWVVGGSRLGSGTATPDGGGLYSTLGSGPLPPISVVPENMVTEVAHLPLLGNGARTNETIVDHRVSFELSGEDVARCLQSKSMASNRTFLDHSEENHFDNGEVSLRVGETFNETPGKSLAGAEEEPSYRRQRSVTLGSIKEFNFDSSKGDEALDNKPAVSSEWWANETIAGKDSKPAADGWTFFPILHPEGKYFHHKEGRICSMKKSNHSSLWKGIVRAMPFMKKATLWSLRDGETTGFWTHPWISCELILKEHALRALTEEELAASVASWVDGSGEWDWTRMRSYLPNDVIDLIAGTEAPKPGLGEDKTIWGIERDGRFRLKSAYLLVIGEHEDPPLQTWKQGRTQGGLGVSPDTPKFWENDYPTPGGNLRMDKKNIIDSEGHPLNVKNDYPTVICV